MIQGSGVTNCSVGTPSSKRRATAEEKLLLKLDNAQQEQKSDVLLKPEILVLGVVVSILLERLVGGEDVVSASIGVSNDRK